jgi:hypothetical protein
LYIIQLFNANELEVEKQQGQVKTLEPIRNIRNRSRFICQNTQKKTFGQSQSCDQIQSMPTPIFPHARTLRKAREQVKIMVATGFSTHRIRSYLKKWALWWAMTSATWSSEELLHEFIKSCWDHCIAAFATVLIQDPTLTTARCN